MPSRTARSFAGVTAPMRLPSRERSTVNTCEMFTTLDLVRFASPARRRTLPGESARRRFDVTAQTTTVLIRLALNTLF